MKNKIVCLLLVAACAFAASAKEAILTHQDPPANEGCMREWTPFALTICGPVGLPWGNWEIKGLQIGIINYTTRFSGLQIGGINISNYAQGMQIGVVNVITTDDCPFLPILNWSF